MTSKEENNENHSSDEEEPTNQDSSVMENQDENIEPTDDESGNNSDRSIMPRTPNNQDESSSVEDSAETFQELENTLSLLITNLSHLQTQINEGHLNLREDNFREQMRTARLRELLSSTPPPDLEGHLEGSNMDNLSSGSSERESESSSSMMGSNCSLATLRQIIDDWFKENLSFVNSSGSALNSTSTYTLPDSASYGDPKSTAYWRYACGSLDQSHPTLPFICQGDFQPPISFFAPRFGRPDGSSVNLDGSLPSTSGRPQNVTAPAASTTGSQQSGNRQPEMNRVGHRNFFNPLPSMPRVETGNEVTITVNGMTINNTLIDNIFAKIGFIASVETTDYMTTVIKYYFTYINF